MPRRVQAVGVAFATLVAMAGCGSVGDATRTAGNDSKVVSSDASGERGSKAEQAESGKAASKLAVVDQGFTQLPRGEFSEPRVTFAAVIENSGQAIATDAKVQITFMDKAGSVVSSEESYLTAVLPGTRVALADVLYDVDGVTDMKVQVLPGNSEPLQGAAENFVVAKVKTVSEEDMGLTTTGTVTSPFAKDLEDLYVAAVYRDSSKAIVGGGFTFLSFVPAKGSAGVEVNSMADGLKPATTELYVSLSGLSLLN